jgi:hypothetical protein
MFPAQLESLKNAMTAILLDTTSSDVVPSTVEPQGAAVDLNPTIIKEIPVATITLVRSDKSRKSRSVFYTAVGYLGSVKFSKSFFVDKTGPESLELTNDAFVEARQPKVKLSKEERKALRLAQPKVKLTLEEKLARAEARTAKLRAKLATDAAA